MGHGTARVVICFASRNSDRFESRYGPLLLHRLLWSISKVVSHMTLLGTPFTHLGVKMRCAISLVHFGELRNLGGKCLGLGAPDRAKIVNMSNLQILIGDLGPQYFP